MASIAFCFIQFKFFIIIKAKLFTPFNLLCFHFGKRSVAITLTFNKIWYFGERDLVVSLVCVYISTIWISKTNSCRLFCPFFSKFNMSQEKSLFCKSQVNTEAMSDSFEVLAILSIHWDNKMYLSYSYWHFVVYILAWSVNLHEKCYKAVADPGFPVGGAPTS